MAEGGRLPHLQRPVYQPAEPAPQPVAPAQRATVREQKLVTESLPRPLHRQDEPFECFVSSGQLPPPIDSSFPVKEQGVSNPRFLRMSLNSILTESSKSQEIGLPVGCIWQPLAEVYNEDEQPARIESSPFRCTRCMAYVNPFFKFIDGGRKCICNICGLTLDTPESYLRDRTNKVELYAGTYDFVAPSEYSNRPSQIPLYLFCIEISTVALQLGLIHQAVSSIQAIIDYLPVPERTLIGIITYDSSIQVYKVLSNGELTEIIMTDVNDPFIPEPVSGCCYNASTQREALNNLLEKISTWPFVGTSKLSLAVGGVVHAVKESILKARGGRVIIFSGQNGQVGKYSLPSNPDTKLNHGEKEKLYLPAESYLTLSHECSAEDICVDIFACGQNINCNSLAVLCSQTGGDLYYFPTYRAELDGERVYYLITRILTRNQASQVVMRARCSNNLSIDHYVGKYKRRGPVEMEAACLDSDKAFGILVKYDEKLTENTEYYIQCAMLYTDAHGKRLIRVNNGKVMATKSIPSVFKNADPEVVNALWLKSSASDVFEHPLNTIREQWHAAVIKVIVTHRQTLGETDLSKILIPETLKMLPLYCNSSLKMQGLTLSHIPNDTRLASIHQILGLSALSIRLLVYPKAYSMHDILEQSHEPGTLNNYNTVVLPKQVGCSQEFIKSEGVYLINNGENLLIYVGRQASSEFLTQVWGLSSYSELLENPEYWPLRDLETEENQKILAIVEEVRKRNPGTYASLLFHFEGQGDDSVFKRMMAEDNNLTELAYGDFLMRLHKVVLNKIRKE